MNYNLSKWYWTPGVHLCQKQTTYTDHNDGPIRFMYTNELTFCEEVNKTKVQHYPTHILWRGKQNIGLALTKIWEPIQ